MFSPGFKETEKDSSLMTPVIQSAACCFLIEVALPESFLAKFWSTSYKFSVSSQENDSEELKTMHTHWPNSSLGIPKQEESLGVSGVQGEVKEGIEKWKKLYENYNCTFSNDRESLFFLVGKQTGKISLKAWCLPVTMMILGILLVQKCTFSQAKFVTCFDFYKSLYMNT